MYLCCYCPAGCWFSGSSGPSQASWPRSHQLTRLAACCGCSPAIGRVTRSSLSPNRLGWGWGGGEAQHRATTGCEGPPDVFCVAEEAGEAVVQHGWRLARCTGPPGSPQAKAADLTCHVKSESTTIIVEVIKFFFFNVKFGIPAHR